MIYEVSLQNYKWYIGVACRSPSEDDTEFENLLSNFDEMLSKSVSTNSLFRINLCHFNAWCSLWWKEDKTTVVGTHLEDLTSLNNSYQLISKNEKHVTALHSPLLIPKSITEFHAVNLSILNNPLPPSYEQSIRNKRNGKHRQYKKFNWIGKLEDFT